MNISVLDYVPFIFSVVVTLYSAVQMARWAERGKYRWLVYAQIACLGVWSSVISHVQVEALRAYDTTQDLSADCITDYECEQLEMPQVEESDK